MSVNKKVPEIRFKGFSEAWVKEILSELVKLENGFAFQSKYFKKTPTKVIVLTPGSVNIGGGFQAGKGQYYDEKQEVSSKYIFKPGDMFITMTDLTPTAQALGFPAIIPKDENTYLHNQRLGKLVGFNGDLAFFYSLLRTMKKQKEVVSTSSGTTVKHTSPDKFLNRICLFPNKEEQTKIGNYFQKLDALINQHQQKHDKLNSIKKAMLKKMFPKQGETTPEIRFKEFSGEWDEISLLDSIERIIDFRGRTPKKLGLDWSPSGYRALSALNVKQGYIDFSIDPHFGNQELYDKWMNGSELHQGQVLFTTEAPMGNVAQVPNTDKYILSQRTIAFVVKSEIISEDFLAVLLRSYNVFRELSALSSGGTAKGVSQKVLANLNVSIPTDLVEQTAIGNYFQKLDALINQHQQQITKLNNIKQACLSKMFV